MFFSCFPVDVYRSDVDLHVAIKRRKSGGWRWRRWPIIQFIHCIIAVIIINKFPYLIKCVTFLMGIFIHQFTFHHHSLSRENIEVVLEIHTLF